LRPTVDWYYDFVSPYSYLQTFRFADVHARADIRFRPVLFAALLDHWGTVGPAEFEPKRTFSYRFVQWQARRMGVPYRLPPAHPFNSLKALRLAIALGGDEATVLAIFRCVWQEGWLPDREEGWRAMCEGLAAADADQRIQAPRVKDALRENVALASATGVFGVPTFVANGQLFWGLDSTDFLLDTLDHPALLNDPAMVRIAAVPVGAVRPSRRRE
jgi:2-hydroxychromene-2-carboxylate isomerase